MKTDQSNPNLEDPLCLSRMPSLRSSSRQTTSTVTTTASSSVVSYSKAQDLPVSFYTSRSQSRKSSTGDFYSGDNSNIKHLFPQTLRTPLQDLDDVLHKQGCFETEDSMDCRKEALKKLNFLVNQWIQSTSLESGMHWQDMEKIGGTIVTYGSYRLGISHQGDKFFS